MWWAGAGLARVFACRFRVSKTCRAELALVSRGILIKSPDRCPVSSLACPFPTHPSPFALLQHRTTDQLLHDLDLFVMSVDTEQYFRANHYATMLAMCGDDEECAQKYEFTFENNLADYINPVERVSISSDELEVGYYVVGVRARTLTESDTQAYGLAAAGGDLLLHDMSANWSDLGLETQSTGGGSDPEPNPDSDLAEETPAPALVDTAVLETPVPSAADFASSAADSASSAADSASSAVDSSSAATDIILAVTPAPTVRGESATSSSEEVSSDDDGTTSAGDGFRASTVSSSSSSSGNSSTSPAPVVIGESATSSSVEASSDDDATTSPVDGSREGAVSSSSGDGSSGDSSATSSEGTSVGVSYVGGGDDDDGGSGGDEVADTDLTTADGGDGSSVAFESKIAMAASVAGAVLLIGIGVCLAVRRGKVRSARDDETGSFLCPPRNGHSSGRAVVGDEGDPADADGIHHGGGGGRGGDGSREEVGLYELPPLEVGGASLPGYATAVASMPEEEGHTIVVGPSGVEQGVKLTAADESEVSDFYSAVDSGAVETLVSWGISRDFARVALRRTDNDVQEALKIIAEGNMDHLLAMDHEQ